MLPFSITPKVEHLHHIPSQSLSSISTITAIAPSAPTYVQDHVKQSIYVFLEDNYLCILGRIWWIQPTP